MATLPLGSNVEGVTPPNSTPDTTQPAVPASWNDPARVLALVWLIAQTDLEAAAALWIEYKRLSKH